MLAGQTIPELPLLFENAWAGIRFRDSSPNRFISRGGFDYAREMLTQALGDKKSNEIVTRLADTLRPITDLLYEAKLYYESKSGDRVRTFCMCPGGFVAMEDYRGLKTVNGHSFKDKKSRNTNFAVLLTQTFTEPFDDPLGYGRYISGLANKLAGGGVLVQRLGDLRDGRRSKAEKMKTWMVQPSLGLPDAVPGDLAMAIPHRHLTGLIEMLDALEDIAPGIASKHTLLYGIEVKFYSNKVETDEQTFETKLSGLYAAGDGSGYTRGLMQASMNGVLVGRDMARKLTGRREEGERGRGETLAQV
jgi:uncharacterized FAD-dependent dehydrogenase